MRRLIPIYILLLLPVAIFSQELKLADYERAVSFARDNYYNKTAFNLYTSVEWMPNGKYALFSVYDENGKTYHKVDLENYKISPLLDQDKLKALLDIEQDSDLILNDLELKGDTLSFDHRDTSFLLHLKEFQLQRLDIEAHETSNPMESTSPDGKWVAFVKDYNLFIRDVASEEIFQLTADGEENYEYASYYGWFDKMEGENGNRPERFAVNWSPDSKYLRAALVDLRTADKMFMLDYSQDDQFRPTLYSYYRGSPGDTNMVKVTQKVFNVIEKKEIAFELPVRTHINSMQLRWNTDNSMILVDTKRGFQQKDIYLLDLVSGSKSLLFQEKSETNIPDFRLETLEKENMLIFLSQRSGWRQLYSYSLDKSEIIPLTNGEFVINDLLSIDEENGMIYFMASGVNPEMNPYHQQLFKVDLKGKMTLLTPEAVHHRVNLSPDRSFFVDNLSTVQQPTETILRSTEDGEILAKLTKADISQLEEKGWNPPLVFSTTGKDGKTPIFGALWRPTHFDPSVKYPIIDHSYTGPHTQVFPKSFDQALNNQALAELGFVVVMIDGLGTAGRSREFANYSYKNMGNNLEDHIIAIKYLAEQNDWIDLDRVGIFGHSAGGYDAGHAVLAFPDFYKVAVASSADHDFRMEKAWWPEMYMGWPVDSTYHEVSNVTLAPNLKGKLLLVHGNMDDNVNVSATYKLSEALVKADKEFDLLILPSQRHGYSGDFRKYFIKKRWNYFVEHLAQKEPIWEFSWD